ncbi:MAG TPA: hypothetical protein VMU04_08765 [Candidatus Acidoferrum sp.]|nr:hypothetical protein [Candidatus Acidoferrum sp.]
MKLNQLHQKLIEAARTNLPSDAVPYAFPKRIMARLPGRTATDPWASWSHALWRAAATCFAIMLLSTAWTFLAPHHAAPGTDLSQEFENTLVAAVGQDQPADSAW